MNIDATTSREVLNKMSSSEVDESALTSQEEPSFFATLFSSLFGEQKAPSVAETEKVTALSSSSTDDEDGLELSQEEAVLVSPTLTFTNEEQALDVEQKSAEQTEQWMQSGHQLLARLTQANSALQSTSSPSSIEEGIGKKLPDAALAMSGIQTLNDATDHGVLLDEILDDKQATASAFAMANTASFDTLAGVESLALASNNALSVGQSASLINGQAETPNLEQAPLTLQQMMDADEMSERVQMMLSKNLKQVDIRLDPPELGKVHIRLNLQGEQAQVQFVVSHTQTREALEHSMSRLREMLSQQGIELADTSVQQQNSGQQAFEQQAHHAFFRNDTHSLTEGELGLDNNENINTDLTLEMNLASKPEGISYYA